MIFLDCDVMQRMWRMKGKICLKVLVHSTTFERLDQHEVSSAQVLNCVDVHIIELIHSVVFYPQANFRMLIVSGFIGKSAQLQKLPGCLWKDSNNDLVLVTAKFCVACAPFSCQFVCFKPESGFFAGASLWCPVWSPKWLFFRGFYVFSMHCVAIANQVGCSFNVASKLPSGRLGRLTRVMVRWIWLIEIMHEPPFRLYVKFRFYFSHTVMVPPRATIMHVL